MRKRWGPVRMLALIALASLASSAAAQPGAGNAPANKSVTNNTVPAAEPAPPAPVPTLSCQTLPAAKPEPPGNAKLKVLLGRDATLPEPGQPQIGFWRARGEDLSFTISGPDFTTDNLQIAVCFAWTPTPPKPATGPDGKPKPSPPPPLPQTWYETPVLHVADVSNAHAATYSAKVPNLPAEGNRLWNRITHDGPRAGASTALGLAPLADVRIYVRGSATAAWLPLDYTEQVGITDVWFSVALSLVVAAIAWLIVVVLGKGRGVPGRDPVLKVISTKAGVASLSQLQMLIWTFVVLASAVYVMSLSGDLIMISSGTLVLLGISGGATLGSKLQNVAADSAQPTPPAAVPGAVGALLAQDASPDDIALTWSPPIAGGPVDSYTVAWRTSAVGVPGAAGAVAAGLWNTVTSSLRRPGFRVTGLTAGTSYDFQVAAINDAGLGATAVAIGATQPTPVPLAAVTGLSLAKPPEPTRLSLRWAAVAGATRYIVSHRRRESPNNWAVSTVTNTSGNPPPTAIALNGLDALATYDVRVSAATDTGAGPAQTFSLTTSGPRKPQWSDLVVDSDAGRNEIDITRVQMLFFTAVIAAFVLMTVLTSGQIPEIPQSFLLLMGISNGVYLGAKFIPSR